MLLISKHLYRSAVAVVKKQNSPCAGINAFNSSFTHTELHRFNLLRKKLIVELNLNGIHDEKVLSSFRQIPRHLFLPKQLAHLAYENIAVNITRGETLSKPLILAEMMQAAELKDTDTVLEIGRGVGYNAAILSKIVKKVFTVNDNEESVFNVCVNLRKCECDNVTVTHNKEKYTGLPAYAPYDAILVSGSVRQQPSEQLKCQLADRGRLIVPVFDIKLQRDRMHKITRHISAATLAGEHCGRGYETEYKEEAIGLYDMYHEDWST